jgi:mannosyltransferase
MAAPARSQRPPDAGDAARTLKDHSRFLTAVVVVAAAGLWIPQLMSSLWADETVTHWIVKDGIRETIHRSLEFEGESPFYFIVQYGLRHVAGRGELAMRLPSLLAMIGAAFLLWRLGRRLMDDDQGILGALVLVATPGITFAAGDARPYPLAVLGLVASTLLLVRWADDGKSRDGIAYVILTAAALYMHYFALTALVVHPLYVWRRRDRIRPQSYILAVAAIAASMAPVVPHFLALLRRRDTLAINFAVSADDYFAVLVPPLLVGSIAFGALIARRWDSLRASAPEVGQGTHSLVVGWWVVPPTLLFLAKRLGSTTLFEPRFFFFALPGLALASASAVRFLEPDRIRRVVAVAVAVGALAGFGAKNHSGEDWRSVAEVERSLAGPGTTVLLRPNFIEAAQMDWLTKPDKVDYLLSVLSPYPMRGRIVPIPYDYTPSARAYLEPMIPTLANSQRFLLINDRGRFRPWLEGRLPGFRSRRIPVGGVVALTVFDKAA